MNTKDGLIVENDFWISQSSVVTGDIFKVWLTTFNACRYTYVKYF